MVTLGKIRKALLFNNEITPIFKCFVGSILVPMFNINNKPLYKIWLLSSILHSSLYSSFQSIFVYQTYLFVFVDATIYVGGLDEKVSETLLWELFLQAGPVGKKCKIWSKYSIQSLLGSVKISLICEINWIITVLLTNASQIKFLFPYHWCSWSICQSCINGISYKL